MLIWEMIKELTENPRKKFRVKGMEHLVAYINNTSTSSPSIIFQNESYTEIGENNFKESIFHPRINFDWQEVKQPVTWQEAIQAWLDGKSIVIQYAKGERRQSPACKLGCEGDLKGLNRIDFTEGKWFIE